MIMDEGLGFIRAGMLPRLPSMSPRATAFSRNSSFAKVGRAPGVARVTPVVAAARARMVAAHLANKPAVAETAAAQGFSKGEIISRIMQQPAVKAAIAEGTSPVVLAKQIAARPESVADALDSRPPLMQRVSPTVDVTDVPPEYSAMPAIPTSAAPVVRPRFAPPPVPSYASLPAPSSEMPMYEAMPAPDYNLPGEPDYSQPQEDIFSSMNPDNPMGEGDDMGDAYMGNIRSSIMMPEIKGKLGYARSEMDGMGNLFSDIVGGYMTRQSQQTAIALSQQQTAQAQAAARVAEAEARAASAQAASKGGGFQFSPVMLLPVAAGLGILLFLKMRKRK